MKNNMISCNRLHEQIIYCTSNYSHCPLCSLMHHNNEVHDFIEKNGYAPELVEYQNYQKEIREKRAILE